MSNTLYQIYQSKAIVLAKTMVLKLPAVADAINKDLIERGYEVDQNDPTTWKYYLNLFGLYHQYDHDRLKELSNGEFDHIRIKVAGDIQPVEVDFTKELIYGEDSDLAIANEYRYNTQYYNALVAKYPEFVSLIKGILNPVSPSISVPALDGEILYVGGYSKTLLPSGNYHFIRQDYGPLSENYLIETNEENLIPLLQQDIYSWIGRWENVNYAATNNLFYPMFLGIIYQNIPMMLGNVRLRNIKSPLGFTHSFHVREYLDSHGGLGWVVDHLPKKVSLWLYRNLMWLDANKGKQMIFDSIVKNVLSPSNIPLSGHRLKHDLSKMDEDDNFTAYPYLERDIINFKHTGSGADYNEILDVIKREQTLAVENYYDQEGQASRVSNSSKYSMFDNLDTKVLESTVIDSTGQLPFTLDDVGLNLWLFAASHGMYKGTILVSHPLNNDRLQLTPLNAYILAFYCLNKGWADYEFEYVPKMFARLIAKSKTYRPDPSFTFKPTLEEMKWGTTEDHIDDSTITKIIGSFEPDFTHNSAISLNGEINRQYSEITRQYFEYCKIEDSVGRAYGEHVSHHQWWYNIECKLVDQPTKYSDWLIIHGIDVSGFDRSDYVEMGLALVEASTLLDTSRLEKLKNKQNAALSILKHFASYTIQIIQATAIADSFSTNGKTIRVSDDKAKAKSAMRTKLIYISADVDAKAKDGVIHLGKMGVLPAIGVNESMLTRDRVETNLRFTLGAAGHKDRVTLNTITAFDVNIPEVFIDPRVKQYGNLTSHPYPVYQQIDDNATLSIVPLTVELGKPALPAFEETVGFNSGIYIIDNHDAEVSSERMYKTNNLNDLGNG